MTDDEVEIGALCDLPVSGEYRLSSAWTLLVVAFACGFVGGCYVGGWVYDELDAVDCLSDFVGGFGGMYGWMVLLMFLPRVMFCFVLADLL